MFDFDRLRYLERGMRLRWDTDEGAAVEKEVLKRFVVAVVVIVVVVVLSVVGLKVFLFQGGRDPVLAYDNWQETRTLEELERIKSANHL